MRNSVPYRYLLASIQVVVRPLPAERAVRVSIIRFPVIVGGAILFDEGPRPALDEGVAEARRVEVEARVGGLADLLEVFEGVGVRTLVVRLRAVKPFSVGDVGDGGEQEVLVPGLQPQHPAQDGHHVALRPRARAQVVHRHAEEQHEEPYDSWPDDEQQHAPGGGSLLQLQHALTHHAVHVRVAAERTARMR